MNLAKAEMRAKIPQVVEEVINALPIKRDGRNFVIYAGREGADFKRGEMVGFNQAREIIIKSLTENK